MEEETESLPKIGELWSKIMFGAGKVTLLVLEIYLEHGNTCDCKCYLLETQRIYPIWFNPKEYKESNTKRLVSINEN